MNHLVKALHQTHGQWLTGTNLLNPCKTLRTGLFLDAELKLLTLETLDRDYPSTTWTLVYTNVSAENAVRNGRGCVYIRLPDGSSMRYSVATGLTSTNFRAEASALLTAAQLFNQRDGMPDHTVFLTDCRAVLQSLQTRMEDKTLRDIQSEIQALSARTTTVLQWIPSHRGITGNEEADKLSKAGSRLIQSAHPLSFGEAKIILRSHFRNNWREQHPPMGRSQQVIILILHTGHCHLYKLKISHMDQCLCDTAPKTTAHVLLHKELRRQNWPSLAALQDKL
ncbi:uncharacterized protein LOC143300828 [Babylonia areolata]|uniref:uncharacterized protein LOC143300828 n=1 Tax=Babylonia areolata TaxID=304850 RepID=UPI003FCF914B